MKYLLKTTRFSVLLWVSLTIVQLAHANSSLPQLGELLKEAEAVTVHKQSLSQLLVSWPSDDDRKLSERTLRILKRVVGVAEKNKELNVYVSVSAVAVENTPGLSQLNSEYKAAYIQKALVKQCSDKCQAFVAGVGSAMNTNKVFVAILQDGSKSPNIVAFE